MYTREKPTPYKETSMTKHRISNATPAAAAVSNYRHVKKYVVVVLQKIIPLHQRQQDAA
jgi:hypothetical protein